MSINDRVKYLRKNKLNMTQEDFSKKIKISRSNLGSLETNKINVTDRVISDICTIFNVNEDWLRNGGSDDDIFVELSENEELTMYTQMLLESQNDIVADTIKNFMVIYNKLDDTSKDVLKNVTKELLQNMATSVTGDEDIDIDELTRKVPDTYQELEVLYETEDMDDDTDVG